MRRSANARTSRSSALPVPLNSSKMMSSIRLSVSTRAVAMTVSEPPPSAAGTARAPEQPLGLGERVGVEPAGHGAAAGPPGGVVRARQPGERIEHNHDVATQLHLPACVL